MKARPMHLAAATELERRKFWRNFFTNGIASWIALIISGFSLYFSIIKIVVK
jgi:hypothetical protein